MDEGLSLWSSMVLRKSQTCFSDRHTHLNSMYSKFCHVLKYELKLLTFTSVLVICFRSTSFSEVVSKADLHQCVINSLIPPRCEPEIWDSDVFICTF